MPIWTDQPPSDAQHNALPLMRCPSGKAIVAVVTSHNLIGTRTHFFHGRTTPCEQNDCKPCLEGVPWRWHGYVTAYSPTDHLHFLFEMTARAAEPMIKFREEHAVLRGCTFRAQRANLSKNSRVFIDCKMADLANLKLPDPPDLIGLLSVIWNLPKPELTPSTPEKGAPAITVTPGNNRVQQMPPDRRLPV